MADTANMLIRAITSLGSVTTLGGNGVASSTGDDGTPNAATFYVPNNLNFDTQGNLYISESAVIRLNTYLSSLLLFYWLIIVKSFFNFIVCWNDEFLLISVCGQLFNFMFHALLLVSDYRIIAPLYLSILHNLLPDKFVISTGD